MLFCTGRRIVRVKFRKYIKRNFGMADWIAPGKIVDGTHFKVSGPESELAETVMCVHGVGAYHSCLDGVASALVDKGFRVIQYDLIGRGFSANHKTNKFGADEHIDQLHHLLVDTLHINKPVHIIGHSMGGALVTLFTCKYPELIKSIMLFAPAGLMDPGPLPLLRIGCVAGLARWVLGWKSSAQSAWRKDFYNHSGVYLERLEFMIKRQTAQFDNNPGSIDAFFQTVLQFPLCNIDNEVKTVAALNIPIHLAWGVNDLGVPFNPCFNRFKTILEKGQCKFTSTAMEKAAHGFFMEYPEETHAFVLKFYEDNFSENKM